MDSLRSRRLAGVFFFASAMIFGLFMYQIVRHDPTVQAAPVTGAAASGSEPTLAAKPPGERMAMQVGQAVVIGRSRIVFRGLTAGRVHFDHYLLDDNPHYAFAYAVPEDEARGGFRIGVHALKVTHVGRTWVHFKRLESRSGGAG
jgi:hypothetical protein